MNKITKLIAVSFLSVPFYISAQVSTSVEKRVAVLEEYTGNNCTYCPDGHKIAKELEDTYGDKVITLKIQTGGYSGTDPIFGGTLETPTGEDLMTYFDPYIGGYPAGSVNRHPSYLGLGRDQWASPIGSITSQNSPVNVLVTSDIDITARTLDVTAEYYYTSDEDNATNYLHIGYYQDNIPGYQYYSTTLNPSMVYFDDIEMYEFDHCFRDNLTGTWGEVIAATTTGSTASVTKSITLPTGFNGFDVEAGAIKVFAYISKSAKGEIISGDKNTPTYNNFPNTDEISIIYSQLSSDEECLDASYGFSPRILLATKGGSDLNSFVSDYGQSNNMTNYTWNGTLKHNEKIALNLPTSNFTVEAINNLSVEVSLPNGNVDPDNSDNSNNTSFNGGIVEDVEKIMIETKTDQYAKADKNKWRFYDGNGNKLADSKTLKNNETVQQNVIIPAGTDCYSLLVFDEDNDGFGNGSYIKIYDVTDGNKNLLVTYNGNFGNWSKRSQEFTSTGKALAISDTKISSFNIYPNPTNGNTNIEFNVPSTNNVSLDVINTLGQVVLNNNLGVVSGDQKVNIDGNNLVNGIYFVNIKIGNNTTTQKLTVSK